MGGVAEMDVSMGMFHLSKIVGCMVVVGRGGFGWSVVFRGWLLVGVGWELGGLGGRGWVEGLGLW